MAVRVTSLSLAILGGTTSYNVGNFITVVATLNGGLNIPTDTTVSWSTTSADSVSLDLVRTRDQNDPTINTSRLPSDVYGVFSCNQATKGTFLITAISRDGNIRTSIPVTVSSLYDPATGVTITGNVPIALGDNSKYLTATVNPGSARQAVIWSYSGFPSGVATEGSVAADSTYPLRGNITTLANGDFNVIATTVDGTKSATAKVVIYTPPTAFWLDTSFPITLIQGATKTIKATAFNPNALLASLPSVTSTSQDTNLVTFAAATFTAAGTAVLTASSTNTGSTTVTITAEVVDGTGTSIGQVGPSPKLAGVNQVEVINNIPVRINTLTVNVLPPNPFNIDLFNVSPQGYSSKNGLVDTITLMDDCTYNIPVLLNMPSSLYSTYNDVTWTTGATPSTDIIVTPIRGTFPSCNVRVRPNYSSAAAKTIVLKGTTKVGGLTDSITLVIPAIKKIASLSLDTANIVGGTFTPGVSPALGTLAVTTPAVGDVVYIPVLLTPAALSDITLNWTVTAGSGGNAAAIRIVPSNGQLTGCNFTVLATGTSCVLTATSLDMTAGPNPPAAQLVLSINVTT